MAEYASIFLIGLIFSFIFITPRCLNLFTYFFSTLVVEAEYEFERLSLDTAMIS